MARRTMKLTEEKSNLSCVADVEEAKELIIFLGCRSETFPPMEEAIGFGIIRTDEFIISSLTWRRIIIISSHGRTPWLISGDSFRFYLFQTQNGSG